MLQEFNKNVKFIENILVFLTPGLTTLTNKFSPTSLTQQHSSQSEMALSLSPFNPL